MPEQLRVGVIGASWYSDLRPLMPLARGIPIRRQKGLRDLTWSYT